MQQGHYVSDENYVHTDNNFTDDDKTELDTLHQMRINDEFGKVDGVAVNDVEQPIENKIVKLTIDKSTVGLDKVDNTSDKDKPVSDAVQLELDSINTNLSSTQTDLSSFKEETNRNISDINSTITSEVTRINQELQTTTTNINTLDGKVDDHINNQNNPHNVTKEQIGLGNVDNTSDLNKPISTQTQTALDGLNQTITNNFNNLNSSIENETERATLAETEISTKLQQEMNTRVQEHAEIQGKISTINSKIPNQASSTNQLADKAFVNSTINSSAAFFKGSFESKAALDAVQWQTTDSSLENYVTNNDYAYIEADETHNNEAWRYIYVKDNTVSEWQPQFRVNESPFTQAQLDAINSGATTDLINSIGSKLTQDAIVDSTGDSSTKAISQRAATLGINTIQNNLNTHILDKNNPHQVTKAQIGLGNVDNTSDLDKPVSTAVRAALNDYLLVANVDSSLNSTSVNPVQNKVLYSPVTFAESERQKSKNLFNINNCLYHKSSNLGETGTNITTFDSNIRITLSPNNLIKVNPNTQYTLSTNNSNFKYAIGQLTSNKTTLGDSGWQTNSSFTITTSSTTEYLGLNFGKTDDSEISETDYNNFLSSNIQVEQGSVATEYQPYNGQITHNGDPAVEFAESERQKSKNLLYIKNTQNTTTITSYPDHIILNGTPNANTEYPYTSSTLPNDVEFEQGKTYTLSRQLISGNGNLNFRLGIVLQDKNGNSLQEVIIPSGQESFTFVCNSNNITKYSSYIIFDGGVTFTNAYYGLQIEEGSVVTDYQPYNGAIVHNKQLTEQLFNYLPLSGGTMTGDIIIPYSFGLKTPDGDILLMPYAGSDGNPGSLYISEKTRNTIINGYRDRPQYNCLASGVTDIALMSDLNSYLPLTGGVLTGQVKLAETGIRTAANDGYSTDKWGNLNALSSDAGALFKINSYDKSKSLTYAWNTGVLNLPAKPLINNQDVLALKSDIISSDNFVTIDTEQTITGKKTFNDLISINKNGIRVDIGAENTFGAHLYASAGDFFAFNKKLIPNTTNSLGLGDTSNKWSSLYTNTSVNIGSCTQTYNASTKSLVYSFE